MHNFTVDGIHLENEIDDGNSNIYTSVHYLLANKVLVTECLYDAVKDTHFVSLREKQNSTSCPQRKSEEVK
uniref:Uncharacterized protein n=1 Tax=Trichobilharzia regenti TaxID=157069 RepID=A0AA85JA63_TRIRE|nr:unnamed protein product [Trichobilharzia regenti]